MPSKSKAQQRFMGLVHSYKKGEVPASKVSKAVKDAAKSMDTKSVKKYASTKHKGKPEKVNKEFIIKKIRELLDTEMESCGYTMSAKDPSYKLKSPGGTGDEDKRLKKSFNEDAEDASKAVIPGAIKVKLQKAMDAIGGKKLTYQQKIKVLGKVIDSLGIDKSQLNKVTQKIRTKIESVNEDVINEMDYKGFVKYMNDFYGPKGVYPDKKGRTLGQKEIGMAYSVLLKKKPNFEIGFDSTDREMLRDILIKLKKLDPTYTNEKK